MTSKLSFEEHAPYAAVGITEPTYSIYLGCYKFFETLDKAKALETYASMCKTIPLLRKMERGLNIPRIGGGRLPD